MLVCPRQPPITYSTSASVPPDSAIAWPFAKSRHPAGVQTAGNLEREQQTCREAISEVNEKEAMPHKALLVTVGLLHDDQIVGYRSAVADNIRQCAFFIQVLRTIGGPSHREN